MSGFTAQAIFEISNPLPLLASVVLDLEMSSTGLDPTLFEDFDHADVLKRFEKSVLQPDSLNFALDFDDSRAFGALDLKVGDLERLLASKV